MKSFYAFWMMAMTMEEAKAALGFDPSTHPSHDEVSKAWKKKIFEMHPDRGGTHEDAVKVNTARDILEGKARPSYERSAPSTAPGGGGYYTHPEDVPYGAPQSRWEPPKKKEVTFEEAKSKAGVPSGVDWKFVTDLQRGKGWSSDESSQREYAFVAYGVTGSEHVFVGVKEFNAQDYYVGGTRNEAVFTMKVLSFPLKGEEGKNPAWLYGNVVKAFRDVGFGGKFNSKVRDAAGWTFGEKPPTSSNTSIKHWLVGSGAVAGDAPSVAGRKHVIELQHEVDSFVAEGEKPKPSFYPEPPARWNTWDGKYHGSYHKLSLLINGKPHELNEEETKRFLGLKLGGKQILYAIYGDYPRGGKKVLTRLKAGKSILEWMTEHLHGLPQDARDALKAAAGQMK